MSTLRIKKGTEVSPSKIESTYKNLKMDMEKCLWRETVQDVNEFLKTNKGFWNVFLATEPSNLNDDGIYLLCFRNDKNGLSWWIE